VTDTTDPHAGVPDRGRRPHDYDALRAFRSAVESFAASYPPTATATHPGAAVIAHLREILKEFR
jgi:hypothetical protein